MTQEGGNPSVNPTPEEAIEALIAGTGLDLFSADIRAEVEDILSVGQALEPEARGRFVDAANRGRRHASLSSSALEVVLFNLRREGDQDVEDIAAKVQIDVAAIRAIERGDRTITSEPAEKIASWALNFDLDRDLVQLSLRHSLARPATAGSYAQGRELPVPTDGNQFIQDVLDAFDRQVGSSPSE